jgi:hypothetical protein
MQFQLLGKPERLLRRKRLLQRGDGMSIQIVHDQNHFFCIRILTVNQPLYLTRPVLFRPLRQRFRVPPTSRRFGKHENTTSPLTPVFVIHHYDPENLSLLFQDEAAMAAFIRNDPAVVELAATFDSWEDFMAYYDIFDEKQPREIRETAAREGFYKTIWEEA